MFDAPLTAKIWTTLPVFEKHQPTERMRMILKGTVGDDGFEEYGDLLAIAQRGKGSAVSIRVPEAEAGCKASLVAQLEEAQESEYVVNDATVTRLKLAGGDSGPEFSLSLEFAASEESVVWCWNNRRRTCRVVLTRSQMSLEGVE